MAVHATEVLVEVLLAGEAEAVVALAVGDGALEGFLGAAVVAVDFALVPEKAARVCEAAEFLAAGAIAAVRAVMFVHVLPG